MVTTNGLKFCALTGLCWASVAAMSTARQPAAGRPTATSSAQKALDRAPQEGQYTFLLFHRREDAATKAMAAALQEGLTSAQASATSTRVLVTNPVEQAVVRRFGVARAPMPLIVAVAPNGAVTGVFPGKFAAKQVAGAIVSPGMMHSMKAMQDKKIVFVCISAEEAGSAPAVIDEFAADPHYQGRIAVVNVVAADPAEKQFMDQLEIDPAQHQGMTMAVLAPPAVLVGKFAATATREEISSALVEAGKCCDDPNCKHRKTARSNSQATR